MRVIQSSSIVGIESWGYFYSMHQTFPYRLVGLQKDPAFFTPEKLAELQVVFDRVCDEMNLSDIYEDPRQWDKLATITLILSKAYHSEDALVNAAISAMQVHTPQTER